jgi:ribosomal protein L29
MLVNELRKLPEKELQDKVAEIRERLFKLSFKGTAEEGTNPSEVRELRKDIARIQGVLSAAKSQGKPKVEKVSRAERVCRNLRAAWAKAQAAKVAAAPKTPAKKGGNKGNKAKTSASPKAPSSKAPIAEKKA